MRSRHDRDEEMDVPDRPVCKPFDWDDFYRGTAGRDVRPIFAKGIAAVGAAGLGPGDAVDVGFGDGTETLRLLFAGWRVTAIDPTPGAAALLSGKVPAELADRVQAITGPAEDADLPRFDLLYAGYALSFIEPTRFATFWAGVRDRLRLGGMLVVNVFGVNDTWAGRPNMTFVDRAGAIALVDGLEVIAIDEEDADGESASGPKHWHVFDLIARRPIEGLG